MDSTMKKEATKKKVLVVGPSDTRSRGGMATVIRGIRESRLLNEAYDITIFPSYIDGSLPVRLLYSVYGYLRFLCCYRSYDLFHIHVAAFGSTFRKNFYLKTIKRAGKPVILHIHWAKFLVFYEALSPKKKQIVRRFLHRADLVLALSDGWKQQLETIFDLTNCRALPNGIDTEELKSARCDIDADTAHTFAFLGRMGQRKGAYDLVDAVQRAAQVDSSIRVLMAGDGEVEEIRKKVREAGVEQQISVRGWVDFAGKCALLRRSATVVLPSYHEGLPMTILEGMASGKAIISTTVGAIPEVIQPENGILIAPGDVNALADALLRCAQDTQMLRRMFAANREKMDQTFSMRKMHERLAEYYEEAMDRKERHGEVSG